MQHAIGSKIWDVDDNEYLDISMGFGSLLFGLIGTKGRPGRVTMRYSLVDTGLEVKGTATFR